MRTVKNKDRALAGAAALVRGVDGFMRAAVVASLAAAGTAGGAPAAAVAAAEISQGAAEHAYDIAPGPLAPALNRFADISGLQLVYDAALADGKTTGGVSGSLTAETALQRLLQGTGLTYAFSAADTVTLQNPTGSGLTLQPITVEGRGEDAYGPVLGYSATRSATGTKTDTPIHETPASIQVVPRDVMDDQGAKSLKDVYENVSGVNLAGNTLNAQSEVLPMIRGFEADTMMRNGMRLSDVGVVDLLNTERVEVLKGPASILYGGLEPGGMINIVTKRPSATPGYRFQQEAGSFEYFRSEGEATGALNEDGSLSYRAAAAWTDSGSFRNDMGLERYAFGSGLLWKPSDRTEMLLDLSYVYEEQPYDTGVPLGFSDEQLVSDETNFNNPDLDGRQIGDYSATLQTSYKIDDVWKVRNQVLLHLTDAKNESVRPRGVQGTFAAPAIRLRYQHEDVTESQVQTTTDVTADFRLGEVGHKALIGTELFWDKSKRNRYRANLANVTITENPTINVGNSRQQPLNDENTGDTYQGAVYLQDQIEMLENGRLKILAGGRYDAVKTEYKGNGISSPDVVDHDLTGRLGVLFDVTRNTAVYASASQSFNPALAGIADVDGNSLEAERGQQHEVGVKFQSDDQRYAATASVYQIKKRNVPAFDSTISAYQQGVDHKAHGFEFDVSGEVADGLNLLAYYSYTHAVVTKNESDPTEVGQGVGGVPLHKARLWMTYDFPVASQYKGWGVGGGARFVSESTAQFDYDVNLSSYTVFDAAVWYDWNENIKLKINANNLFDKHYYARASDQSIVHPGEPFSVIGTLSLTF